MLVSRKRSAPLLLLFTLTFILLLSRRHSTNKIFRPWILSSESSLSRTPANRTLGFGAVVVVSKQSSDRRHSLVQAANVTDVELTIPPQPKWTDSDIQKFVNGQDGAQTGSVLAWLGHNNVLRW